MKRIAVINVVGLTKSHLGEFTPNLTALANASSVSTLTPPLPAVTCTVQSTMLTGLSPQEHGVVANGWHERQTNETFFWRQSNALVRGEKVWDALRKIDNTFTVANMFWWFNMYSSADFAVTPRPIYCANGKKIPDIWTMPSKLRSSLQNKLGQFPLFNFWGPMANITSTKWIVDATIEVEKTHNPTLTLVYIPHLDYPLQKLGPNHPDINKELQAVDKEVGKLIDHFHSQQIEVCVVSEYGIEEVNDAVAINRLLRKNGLLCVREELSREYLDAGASECFAVPDHQIAHVYVKNKNNIGTVAKLLQDQDGIEFVFVGDDRPQLIHDRSGDIIAVSNSDKWFSHDWWEDTSKAPDYQTTVDIHNKPGYDPRELFLAGGWRGSKARIAFKLLLKKIGFRTLLDVISLDVTKVKGSHGRTVEMGAPAPILIIPANTKKVPQSLPSAALIKLIIDWVNS
ncbi:MAG TPA: alkaline phosphatase family protein [Phycisphaerales bacterium]|nr:alkaline phosphatase family protein [Phycisphaerales bacterium]